MVTNAEPTPDEPREEPRRLLVVAAEAAVGGDLRRRIVERANGRALELWVVAPALTTSRVKHVLGDVDEAIGTARGRLRESVDELAGPGVEVLGYTGESDALLAVEDALRSFPADEILVVTHPEGDRRWAEEKLPQGVAREFEIPVSHLELERRDGDAALSGTRSPVEEGSRQPELDPRPYAVPRLSALTVAGLAVGILGTIGLWVLAAIPTGSHLHFSAIRLLLALYSTLVNLGQIVGLMMFETVRFRRLPERAFSLVALVGTPIAVVISVFVG